MTIDINSWHAKIYIGWYARKYGWSFNGTANLCPYVRVVLFYWWLRWLFKDGTFFGARVPVAAATAVALLPIPLTGWIFGWWPWAWYVILGYLLGIGFLTSAVFVIFAIAWFINTGRAERLESTINKPFSSFGELLAGYYGSIHGKVCPGITFARRDQG